MGHHVVKLCLMWVHFESDDKGIPISLFKDGVVFHSLLEDNWLITTLPGTPNMDKPETPSLIRLSQLISILLPPLMKPLHIQTQWHSWSQRCTSIFGKSASFIKRTHGWSPNRSLFYLKVRQKNKALDWNRKCLELCVILKIQSLDKELRIWPYLTYIQYLIDFSTGPAYPHSFLQGLIR